MGALKQRVAFPEFSGPDRVIFGWDAAARLPKIVQDFDARHVRLVIDSHVKSDALSDALLEIKKSRELTIDTHDGSEPTLEGAVDIALRGSKADLVVAIGGGSTIDTGKAMVLAQEAGRSIERFEGANRVDLALAPLIGLPTTAGTGSEVSGSCVLSAAATGRKISIRSSKLRPAVAVLDPRFLGTVPKGVIRATGVDALAHAMEAYFSTGGSPLTDKLALSAISMLAGALPLYYANPKDPKAAEEMAWGSTIAGIAFTSARVGLAHAVAAVTGPLTGLSHGLSVGLALPHALRINFQSRDTDQAELLAAFGCKPGQSDPLGTVRDRLAAIYRAVEFPKTARDLGLPFEVDDRLIAGIIDSGRLETNPVTLDAGALRDVLRSISG